MSFDTTLHKVENFRHDLANVLSDVGPILSRPCAGAGRKPTNYSTLHHLPDFVPVAEESASEQSSDTDISEERPSDAFVGTRSAR